MGENENYGKRMSSQEQVEGVVGATWRKEWQGRMRIKGKGWDSRRKEGIMEDRILGMKIEKYGIVGDSGQLLHSFRNV